MAYKLAELLGGERVKGDTIVSGLTVDSRAVKPGDMFVALPWFSYGWPEIYC